MNGVLHRMGVTLKLDGDHQSHEVFLNRGFDVTTQLDSNSDVLTIHVGEDAAKELYWELLRIIPKLREDRR